MPHDLTYLSFGAGVQSTALLAMACQGFAGVPRPGVAVFADTGNEPPWVYEQLGFMRAWARDLGVEVVAVSAGNLGHDVLKRLSGENETGNQGTPPMWVRGQDGREAPLSRGCTKSYKLDVIEAEVARRIGRRKGQRKGPTALALIGISFDERSRVKQARKPWLTNSYPLVDLGITRGGCETYLRRAGLPVPRKSACVFCPYHDDRYWLDLRDSHPGQWAEACAWDEKLRDMRRAGVREPAYLHRSLTPLAQVELKPKPTDGGEASLFDPHGFENECEGMCGV